MHLNHAKTKKSTNYDENGKLKESWNIVITSMLTSFNCLPQYIIYTYFPNIIYCL